MRYTLCKCCENRRRDTPLPGVYIRHCGQIWVKISVFGVLYPYRCTDGGESWHEGGNRSPLRAKFHTHRCNVSPLLGEKPQNRPLSNLDNRHFALLAVLLANQERTTSCEEVSLNWRCRHELAKMFMYGFMKVKMTNFLWFAYFCFAMTSQKYTYTEPIWKRNCVPW